MKERGLSLREIAAAMKAAGVSISHVAVRNVLSAASGGPAAQLIEGSHVYPVVGPAGTKARPREPGSPPVPAVTKDASKEVRSAASDPARDRRPTQKAQRGEHHAEADHQSADRLDYQLEPQHDYDNDFHDESRILGGAKS
jgi:hypothetical protein